MPRALFASTTLGTALVRLPSGPRWGRLLPPLADTPADHLRVDLAGIVHVVRAPFSALRHEGAPVGVVPGGNGSTYAPGLIGDELGEGQHDSQRDSGEQGGEVRHGR